MSEPKPSRCSFCTEVNYSFGHPTMQGAASQIAKYLHLFVISCTQPQHCSGGSAAGNNLLCSLELPCLGKSGTAVLASKDCPGHPSCAPIKFSTQGEGEVLSPCVPLPVKDRVRLFVSTCVCPCYPHVFYLLFKRFAS